ncbi:MAG: DNA primase [Candidatus Dormibacteraeota bacterium]|nr:DNA primase [Candidatus Dormibacteraeota bacterium]
MAADAVAEIKARLDIVEVVGGYLTLQRSGREFKGLCPFHAEKTPSFTVSQERQVWYCFGCQQGGDLFAFVERIERADFRQALELLADRAGVELEAPGRGAGRGLGRDRRRAIELNQRAQQFYEHVLWSTPAGAPGRALLHERGVPESLARRFGVGFAPMGGTGGDALVRYLTAKRGAEVQEIVGAGLAHAQRGGGARDRFRHRLVFPIRDERGGVLGFGGRALGDAMPKYLNTQETSAYHKSRSIFGIDLARNAIERERAAVVVEGYFDVIAAHAAGIENVVASSGTALARDQVRALGRYAPAIVLCFDGDDAGRAAASRAVDVVAAEGIPARICLLPDGVKDPDELVRRDPAAFTAMVQAAQPEWQVLLDAALSGGEGGSVDARRAAAERAVSVLARIPEAATRDLYLQQAARRLDVGARSLTQDLARLQRQSPGRPARVVLPQPAASASDGVPLDSVASPDETPLPQWEGYLGGIVVHRPDMARVLTLELGLELGELTHPSVRRIMETAQQANGGGFPLHRLGAGDQALAARLMVLDVPELNETSAVDALERAMRDCVRDVHEATALRSAAEIQRELQSAKDAGRDDEVRILAARLAALAAEAPHLRHTLSAR